MSEPNFIVITGATSDTKDRAGLMDAMGDFAQECKDNGAMRITYGSVLSGKHPNALIFIQFFESLGGFENVMKAIPNSKPYGSMIKVSKPPISVPVIFGKGSKETWLGSDILMNMY